MVELLLKYKADVNAQQESVKNTVVHFAAFADRPIDIFELLISANADVNITNNMGWSPLHAAAGNGNTALVTKLVEAGANLNAGNKELNTPLHLAVYGFRKETVEVLLKAK